MLLKAVAYWFDRYSLLSSSRKEPTFTGGSYTDINAVLPAKLILLAIAVICALRVLRGDLPARSADSRQWRPRCWCCPRSWSARCGRWWSSSSRCVPTRPTRRATYIERNIAATRQAYGITDDKVEYQDYQGYGTKPPRDVPADVTTIANTRLLDPNILSRTFTQQQQLKNFYGFPPSLDIDRYDVDGQMQDYIVAARELSPRA